MVHFSIVHHEVIVTNSDPMETVQRETVTQTPKKMMMVFSEINRRFNCICNYVEVEYEENDEELELMKKVMGFNHFDTTKVWNMHVTCCSRCPTDITTCCLATEDVYILFTLLWVGLCVREAKKIKLGCENKYTCMFFKPREYFMDEKNFMDLVVLIASVFKPHTHLFLEIAFVYCVCMCAHV